jgi:hypothetical protein
MDGQFVCEECVAEESKILRTHHQLSKLDQAIKLYLEDASNQRQHPSQAQVLENEISDFFLDNFADLRTGKGYRINFGAKTQSELDIVIDFNPEIWLSGYRRKILAIPPLAHMEICYRTTFDPKKIKDDFNKIHETVIGGAALNPPQRVWTALIGLGSGWKNKRESVAQIIHAHFHKILPSRISTKGNESFWDFPDVMLFPGIIFKKHDCSSKPGLIDHWPVYILMPSAINDPFYGLRPLAAARGFFTSFVNSALQGGIDIGPSWEDEDSSSILGPNFRLEEGQQTLFSLVHAPKDLFIRSTLLEGHTEFLHFKARGPLCDENKKYWYIRDRYGEFYLISPPGIMTP